MAIADGQYVPAAYMGAAPTTVTPTITATTGTITTSSGSCRWFRVGNLVFATYTITITTAGTGSGGLRVTLPVNATTTSVGESGCGREIAISGHQCSVTIASATLADVRRYDFSTVIVSGAIVRFSITYEAI